MFDLDKWQEIWHTITRNKMRSVLTAFGVFWGIFMLVVMSGAGHGLQSGIESNIKGFANNTCYFFSNLTTEPYKGFKRGRWWDLHTTDMDAIRQKFPEVKYISAILFGYNSDNNTLRGDKYGTYSIKGLSLDYRFIEPQEMIYGRYINEVDIREMRKVCIIGKRVYEEMFLPGENPLGQILQVNGIAYRVIGVNNPVTQVQIGGRSEETIIIPFSTMQKSYQYGDQIDCIALTAYDSYPVTDLEEPVKMLIKERNRIAPNDLQAVDSMNVAKEFKMFNGLFTGIAWLIWIVGTGTLLAGIVGVSNIMMVTVRERTKEIGVRRALGAKPFTIMVQILSESMVLTCIAGFLGLLSGVGLLQIVDTFMSNFAESGSGKIFFGSPQIPFSTAIMASAVLLVLGTLAGLLPAYRALQIKAIDAIREE